MYGQRELTRRELEVLSLVAEGGTHEQIGVHLGISPRTAAVHIQRAAYKLGVSSGAEAASIAARSGRLPSKKDAGSG